MIIEEFGLIFYIVVAVIGGIMGGFAGRNWIYVRLTGTNLAGQEEKIEGEEKFDRINRRYAIAGGIGAIIVGLFFVYIGGMLQDNGVKTVFLVLALVSFAVGGWLIKLGLQK